MMLGDQTVSRLPEPALADWWDDQWGSPMGPHDKPTHSRGMCADSVLAVTLAVLRLVADGCPAEDAMCTCLAQEVEADVAAYVRLTSTAGTASLVAWPRTLDRLRAQVLLDELPAAAIDVLRGMALEQTAHCLSGTAEALGTWDTKTALLLEDVIGCQYVAHVPLDVPGHGVRLLVLARRRRFDAATMELLSCLRIPLTDVLRLVSQPAPARDRGHHDSPGQPAPGLTRRELEVLLLMADGLLARTIATRLDISPRTVHKHVGNIYRKLEVHDRLAAVRLAERLGLLGPAPVGTAQPGLLTSC